MTIHIDSVASYANDPRKCWDHIEQLEPQKKSKLPNECSLNNVELTLDTNSIRKKWSSEF
jgi:hypothetical protein